MDKEMKNAIIGIGAVAAATAVLELLRNRRPKTLQEASDKSIRDFEADEARRRRKRRW